MKKLLIICGVAAALFSITPAFADDTTGSQAVTSNDNSMSTPSDSMAMPSANTDTSAASGGSDEGSPDTATGDDDY